MVGLKTLAGKSSVKVKGAGVADGAVGGVLVRLAQGPGSVSRST